jgi:hypothetical protein
MQRCIFFIVFTLCAFVGFSQAFDVEHYELSFYTAELNVETVSARARLDISPTSSKEVTLHCPQLLQVNQVAWKEGRIKGFLSFRHEGEKLFIGLPQKRAVKAVTLLIDYTIDLSNPEIQAFKLQKEGVMGFNAGAIYQKTLWSLPAMFFPSNPNDSAYFSTNVSYKPGYKSKSIGEIRFQTTQNDVPITDFWDTNKKLLPGSFYLLVGSFEHRETEKLNAELGLTEQSEKRWLAELAANNLDRIMPFLEKELQVLLSEADLLTIDSLSKKAQPNFFIREKDWKGSIDASAYIYEKATLLWHFNFDTIRADETYTRYFIKQHDEAYFLELLLKRWANAQHPDPRLIKYMVQAYKQNQPNFNPSDVALFAEALDTTAALPKLKVKYVYKGGWQQQLIIIEQDTSQAKPYTIPLGVTINSKDSILKRSGLRVAPKPIDTLRLKLNKAPQSVSVNFGTFFPGYIDDQKPDYYALYELNNATSLTQRQQALEQLFKTSNLNLFSTVVGIALRDDHAEIRAAALQAAERLNTVGAYKIKGSLEQIILAEPEPQLQKQAELLYEKLYNPK